MRGVADSCKVAVSCCLPRCIALPMEDLSSLTHTTGLDVERGLRLFGGQAAVYREALHEFVALYAGGLPAIEAYLDSPTDGHLAAARREAHAVGGAGAALGSQTVERLAQEFEACVRQPASRRAAPAEPAIELRREVARLVSALAARLERG